MSHHAIDSARRAMTKRDNGLTPRATNNAARPTPTLPAPQLRAFVDGLEKLGFDVARLLTRAGLRRGDLDDPDATVPFEACGAVIGGALGERRVPNLGAHLAAVTPIGSHLLLDYLILTTDTVRDALGQLARYLHLVAAPDIVTLAVAENEEFVRLLVQPGTDPFTAQYETSIVIHRLREETERRLRVSFVSLIHPPDDVRDLERLLSCPVRAPSAWSGVAFPHETLRVPLRRRDPALRRLLEGHAAAVEAGAPPAGDQSAVASVRTALTSRLGQGVPRISDVARQLTTAPRTLQRRLAAEGVSFHQLVDVVRCEIAERLLADAPIAVSEVGYLLGFSEPSAFHRAFKRWRQVTPQEYRRTRALHSQPH